MAESQNKLIAPKTRRQTNMVSDISGSKKGKNTYYSINSLNKKEVLSTNNSVKMNPITGEEIAINTNNLKSVSFMKEDNSEKSRRLQRILHNFNAQNDANHRSRSIIKPVVSTKHSNLNSPSRMETNPIERLTNRRNSHNFTELKGIKNDREIYTSKELQPSVLPSFSKRKLGRKIDDFSAYNDIVPNSKPLRSYRSRHDLQNFSPKVSHSFNVIPSKKVSPSLENQMYG